MSKAPISVGVVGVGHLGRHHARLYATLPGARLIGVVDLDRERARAIASEYDCAVFDDADELIGKVQAASIAVPTESHCEVAQRLMRGGVDVLIDSVTETRPTSRFERNSWTLTKSASDRLRRSTL